MEEKKWMLLWNCWLAKTNLPGVYERKEGGYLVRARAVDPTTGRTKEIKRTMPDVDEATAEQWLQAELTRIRSGGAAALSHEKAKTRFSDYAVSLLERKLTLGEIRSARGRERWVYTLQHLIDGTENVTGFGDFFVDQIRISHIESWKLGIAKLLREEKYAPTTANGWLAILRVILKAAKHDFELSTNPAEGVRFFDTSEHETYTEEEPNALTKEELAQFLGCMREVYPQHYAMTYLGAATGLRPSSLRPLRRTGETPDVLWDRGVVLVRRSHTLGDEVMETTKTKRRQRINVPAEVMNVLRWHVETQLRTPDQQASELLFPAEDGRFRSPSVLNKPFKDCADWIGLNKRFSARGLRRTFNDLAREAQVESLVTKSISGHMTDKMKDHYSTVQPVEQREGIGRMLRLVHSADVTTVPAPAPDAHQPRPGVHGGGPGAPSPNAVAPVPHGATVGVHRDALGALRRQLRREVREQAASSMHTSVAGGAPDGRRA